MACALVGFGQWTSAADNTRNAYWIGTDGTRHDIEQYGVASLGISNAESLILRDNVLLWSGYSYGAAIYVCSEKGETITSKSVIISGNKAVSTADEQWGYTSSYSSGGALDIGLQYGGWPNGYPADVEAFSFSGCGDISITGNGAQAEHSDEEFIGPDMEIDEEWKKEVEEYPEGDVDTHAQGGAIALRGGVLYDENTGKTTKTLVVLEFKNNEHVLLRGNYITNGTSYILNAIWTMDADVAFAAKSGQVVECYDSLDIDGTLWINTTHPDLRGSDDQLYTGTVILSGEHAEEDLRKIKGSQPTEAEIEESRVMSATAVHVENGTLELREVEMIASRDLSYTDIEGTEGYLFYSTNQAEVKMTDSSLITVWYDGDYEYYGDGGGQTGSGIDDALDQRGAAALPKATFTGRNTIEANYINAKNGAWTFNVGAVNKDNAVLRIVSDSIREYDSSIPIKSRGIDTTGSTFHINVVGSLSKGQYRLLDYDQHLGTWVGRDSVTLAGAASGKIGTQSSGSGSVYITTDGEGILTLWYDFGGGSTSSTTPAQRGATTLTWTAASGTWADSTGASAKAWNGSVSDLNYYDGDSVVFNKAAEVTLAGVVRPASVVVSHEAGQVIFNSKDNGQISGNTSLTKSGSGELVLNLPNAYTGGTVLKGGKISLGHEMALGLGEVSLQGGMLDMGGKEVENTLRATGKSTINGGSAYQGKLWLEGGELSGGSLHLGVTAELKSGTIGNELEGEAGIVKSGSGKVELMNAVRLWGESELQGGTLELWYDSTFGSLELNSGTTLLVRGGLHGGILANAGSTLNAAGTGITLNSGDFMVLEGATVTGTIEMAGGFLAVMSSGQALDTLHLSGGHVYLEDTLQITRGMTTSASATTSVEMSLKKLFAADGPVNYFTVAEGTDLINMDDIYLVGLDGSREEHGKTNDAVWVWLKYERLEWDGASTDKWGLHEDGGEWKSGKTDIDRHFYNLDFVTFSNAGEVEIVGVVNPGDIQVKGDQNTTFTGAGSITGEAELTKEGAGTLEIATDNSNYRGVININEGTLKVGHDNALGVGETYINNATIDANNYRVWGPVIFTGSSRMQNADGLTNVVLDSRSTVSGNYTLAEGNWLTVGSGGATFTGNLTFAGGVLSLTGGVFNLTGEVDAVLGDIVRDVAGSLTLLDLSGWEGLSSGTYLLATMTTEEDAAAWFRLDPALAARASLVYEDGELMINIRSLGVNPEIYAVLNSNQRALYAALGIISSGNTQPTGELAELMATALSSNDPAEVRSILDRMGGAELATAMTSQISGNMAHLHRLRSNMGSAQPLSAKEPFAAYVVGYDEVHRIDGDSHGAGIRRSEWGGTVGFEYGVSENTRVGISLNQGFSKVEPTGSGQRYDEDDTRADIYLVARVNQKWQSMTSVGFALHEYDINRPVTAYRRAHSSVDGSSVNFMQEVSYTARLSEKSALQPFFTIESSYNSIDSFSEGGAGTASLIGDSRHAWATDLTLGARYMHSFRSAGAEGQFRVQAGVVASIGDTTADLNLRFAGAPGVSFKATSASQDRIGYNLGASLLLPVSESTAITASADAILRSNSEEYGVSVGIRTRF